MKLFASGSPDKLCLSAPSCAMNTPHAEPETSSSNPVLVNIRKWQQNKGCFTHSSAL